MPGYHDSKQHHHRLSPISLDAIEEYFAELNPIAKRIAYDIDDTKANYGQLWNTLDYQEQNDIINDTLIKPEICLRYFDNFLTPTPSNSSGNSYESSTDSLTAIVFKDVNSSRAGMADPKDRNKKNDSPRAYGIKFNTHGIKSLYSYDGRNLYTFGMQKVALKVIQDENLGAFRDEHSRPFCYRTKSQINLFAVPPISDSVAARKAIVPCKVVVSNLKSAALKQEECGKSGDEESRKALGNYYYRLKHQLKVNLKEQKRSDSHNSTPSYTCLKQTSISNSRKILNSPGISYKFESNDNTLVSKNLKSSMMQSYINSTQLNGIPKAGLNYAVLSDVYNSAEESSNLLQHYGQSNIIVGSCSSAATSDDDDKTLEEDVHLLDNDCNIRKGFDFLNNW